MGAAPDRSWAVAAVQHHDCLPACLSLQQQRWLSYSLAHPETSTAVQVNFINHFSGCQLCTQQNKEGDYGVCEAEYTKSFEYANGVFSKLLKRMPPRDISHQQQLAATPYCKASIGPCLDHLKSV